MSDVLFPKPLAKAVDERRETQRHLDCLNRQIAARAGRQTITVKVRSRARRRSGFRLYRHELADHLAFERWAELDTLASGLALQQQVIKQLKLCADATLPLVAGQADLRRCGLRDGL